MIRCGVALFLALAVAAPAVAASSATVTVKVASTEKDMDWSGKWTKMSIADTSGDLQPAPDLASVVFEVDAQGFVSMSVGCNRIGSQLLPGEGDAITFAPAMATRMACMGPAGEAEDRLVDAIGKIARYEKRGDDVAFLDADGHALLLIGR